MLTRLERKQHSSFRYHDWNAGPEDDDRDGSDDRKDERTATEVPDARDDDPEDDGRRDGRNGENDEPLSPCMVVIAAERPYRRQDRR